MTKRAAKKGGRSSARSRAGAKPLFSLEARKTIPTRGQVRKAARMRNADRSRVVPDQSLWDQAGRLGGKLTPNDVSNIIRMADAGDPALLMDLANECRQKDCHLSAVLTVAEESIAGLGWKLTLPENARAKDKRAMKWAEEVLKSIPNIRRLISYLAGAPFYGWDVNEILWKKGLLGRLVPYDFAHLAPRRFGFEPTHGGFVLRDQGTPQQGVDFRAKWPNKFIVSQPRANGDAPHREGLCRSLVWMTQFRVWTFADWLRTAELAWKPWRIGKYKKGVSATEDKDGLELVLQKLSTTGWAVMSDDMTVDIEWPQGTQSAKATHAELVNVLAQEESKCVLGQTETVQSSTSSGYAQAKVHDSVRRDIRESRAMQIASDLTRDLVRPLIELNFSGVVIPRWEFLTQDPVDLEAFAKAVAALAKTTLRIPAKWVRDNAGMPEPKEGDEVIGGALTTGTTDEEDEEETDEEDPSSEGEDPEEDEEPTADEE